MLPVFITDLDRAPFEGNIQEMHITNDIAHVQPDIGIKEDAFVMAPFSRVGHSSSTVVMGLKGGKKRLPLPA